LSEQLHERGGCHADRDAGRWLDVRRLVGRWLRRYRRVHCHNEEDQAVTAQFERLVSMTSLSLSAGKVLYGHEQMERLSVSVSSKAGGSKPSGKVAVRKSATKTACVITLSAGKGSCTLKAAQLPSGTYKLVAAYSGSLDFDSSVSSKQTLTVAK
jgi:Bacterial Ig-like domain (group 3)